MDYNNLGNHYYVYIGRDEKSGVYHFRMITSCDTEKNQNKLAKFMQKNPARFLKLTSESAGCLTHDSYIDIEFTVSLTKEQVLKRLLVNKKYLNDKGEMREDDYNRLIQKCHLFNTPPFVVRNSGVYKSIHAL